jgi:hypothetical protein
MSPHFENRTRVLMSGLGQKQTLDCYPLMSALPPIVLQNSVAFSDEIDP